MSRVASPSKKALVVLYRLIDTATGGCWCHRADVDGDVKRLSQADTETPPRWAACVCRYGCDT